MRDKPMRPKENEVGDYICPNCKIKIDIFHMGDTYCGECGQRLNWHDIVYNIKELFKEDD